LFTDLPQSGAMANTNARALRQQMTESEYQLWFLLRGRRLEGCKFRRQHPIGPFVADFACVAQRLIVELDGGQHAETRAVQDARRTAWLEAQGWRVLRFWNDQVHSTPDEVTEAIRTALSVSKIP
jgi:primosomal protein N' (replication factor Y)